MSAGKYNRIYVTGAAGMIGSNLVGELVSQGCNVVGIDNFWRGSKGNVARYFSFKNFRFLQQDLSRDSSWAEDMSEEDLLIHTADIVAGIGYVFQNEYEVFRENLRINTAVAEVVSKKRPSKVIYLGTACSYPKEKQRSVVASVLREDDKFPASPESGYGWSKLAGELELDLACRSVGSRFITLDLHNVYGWPCVFADPTSQVIPSLIYRALTGRGKDFVVWGNGEQGRAFLHVSDVVRAILLAMEYHGNSRNFMIGPSECTSIKEVASIVLSHPKIGNSKVVFDLTKPVGDIGRFADYSLSSSELGWAPTIDIADGVMELVGLISEAVVNER